MGEDINAFCQVSLRRSAGISPGGGRGGRNWTEDMQVIMDMPMLASSLSAASWVAQFLCRYAGGGMP